MSYCQYLTAKPLLFINELSPKFKPTLVQDRTVQTGFGSDVPSFILYRSFGTLAHIPHLQIFDHNHGVVLADSSRRFVQVVFPDIGNGAVKLGDFAFQFSPITAKFNLSTQCTLVAS